MQQRIAYYAHHQGSGHVQHAHHLAESMDYQLLVLSSRDFDITRHATSTFCKLPPDLVPNFSQPKGSPFHYTPNSPVITQRFSFIAEKLKKFKPDVVIVDVSVEVATFVKLLGYPIIYRLLHGDRTDLPHMNIFSLADHVVAYYPEKFAPSSLAKSLVNKITYIGMLEPTILTESTPNKNSVCVLTSTGGQGININDLVYACQQTPQWHWTVLGKLQGLSNNFELPQNCNYLGVVDNPDSYLSRAEVIISAAGHNAVARSSAHKKPLILTPEQRPFNEQLRFAQSIAAVTGIEYVTSWKEAEWNTLLARAQTQSAGLLADSLLVSCQTYGANIKHAINAAISATRTANHST